MSTFVPHGLLSPVIVQGMKIVQRLWRQGLDWDQEIDDNSLLLWNKYVADIRALHSIAIPRNICVTCTSGELHIFVDASEEAFAAAVYWRCREADGTIRTVLITGKARVAPTKPISIPRLELQAALLGSRLAKSVVDETELTVTRRVFWSDSTTVLQWINATPRRFKTFVAHRLAEIEELTKKQEWRWVPTKENPADDATREVPKNFGQDSRWFTGPAFLRSDEDAWPVNKCNRNVEATGEERIETVNVVHKSEKVLSVERFSSWKKLVRTTARVLQFIELCRKKDDKISDKTVLNVRNNICSNVRKVNRTNVNSEQIRKKFVQLEPKHLLESEKVLIRQSQNNVFAEEISLLKRNQPMRKSSKLAGFDIYLDVDNLICVKSRIAKARIDDHAKRPIVLHSVCKITELLILEYHHRFNHGNNATVINELRQRYHILGLRTTVRKLIHRCNWCRLRKSMPSQQSAGDLPRERLQSNRHPFTYVAVDYFGPMNVTVGRRVEKRWGVLFTCLTTRAVHLELAPSLSASSMIQALRRMAARRGMPNTIMSDNGTNFHGADKDLKEEMKKIQRDELMSKLGNKGVTWKFIPPGAPHMGGAWERLVRSVKVALRATLNERRPSEETLYTLLTEAEHTINSRPLTSVSTDPDDEESLTPNHFLMGRSNGAPVIGLFSDTRPYGKADWRSAQRLADHFWRRWVKEYLPELRLRQVSRTEKPSVTERDVVIIADGTLPRNIWPRGEVTKTLPGPDGRTRIVDVRTPGGVFRRPVSRIIVLVPAAKRPNDGAAHGAEDVEDDQARH